MRQLLPDATHPDATDARIPWGPLLRLVGVTAMVFCTMAIVTPTLDELVREPFADRARATTVFMMVHSLPQVLLLGLLVGLWSDRWARRVPIALVGGVGTGITTMLIPFIGDFTVLLGVRLLDGILGVAAVGMLMTRVLDLGGGSLRPRVMGIFMTAIPLGYLVGNLLTWAIGVIPGVGLRTVFVVAGGGLVLASLTLVADLRGSERVFARDAGPAAMWRSLRGMPRLWLPVLFGFVDKFSFALLAMLPALVLRDLYGVTGFAFAGAVMTCFWVGFLVMSAPVGVLTARLGAWRTVAMGSAGYGLCLAAATAFGSPWFFLLFLAAAGTFTALQFVPNMVLVGEMARPDEKATAISAFNLVGSFGLLSGLAFAGYASAHWGYLATFAIVGALELACAGLALWASSRMGPSVAVSTGGTGRHLAVATSPGDPMPATRVDPGRAAPTTD